MCSRKARLVTLFAKACLESICWISDFIPTICGYGKSNCSEIECEHQGLGSWERNSYRVLSQLVDENLPPPLKSLVLWSQSVVGGT